MTLLVISPDYASHLLPLATLATAWRDAGERVVVASGPATATITAEFGFERADLRLGRGSNPGVIRAENQVAGEDDALRGFFAATERGMVETLLYQANARQRRPAVGSGRAPRAGCWRWCDEVRPDQVIVDHLAFSARLALLAGGVPHADVVLGHPSALPVGDEVYGYPPAWPKAFEPDPDALAALLQRCRQVRDDFTDEWNAALEALAPQAIPSTDAFTEHSDLVLLNYPGAAARPGSDRPCCRRTPFWVPRCGASSSRRIIARWLRCRSGDSVGLRQFRQFPVCSRRCAGQGGRCVAAAAGAGGAGHRFGGPGRGR